MTSIKLMLTGAQAWASVNGPLTSGMVGIPVTIEYDEAWNGLTKNLMCRCSPWGSNDGEIRTLLNVGETSTVAHEVMQPDMYLYLGVEGFSGDGTLVIPTTWARCGKIEYGANTSEDLSAEPELPIWNQLQTEVEQIKRDGFTQEQRDEIQAYVQSAAQSASNAERSKDNAVAASNAALSNAAAAKNAADTAQISADNASTSAGSAANLANGALQAQRAAEAAAQRAEAAAGSSQVPADLSEVLETVPGNNLLDVSALVTSFVDNSGGTVEGSFSNYIPVKYGRRYVTNMAPSEFHWFDQDKVHLSTNYFNDNPKVLTPGQTGFLLIELPEDYSGSLVLEGTDIGGYRPERKRLNSQLSPHPWEGKRCLVIADSNGQYVRPGFAELVTRDLGMVLHNISEGGKTVTWGISQLDNMDDQFDLVLVMLGTNDQGYNNALGTIDDSTGTYYANLKALIEKLKVKFPSSVVMLLTMLKRTAVGTDNSNDADGYWINDNGLTTKEFRDAVIEVCQLYSIPYADLYHTIDLRTEADRTLWALAVSDGTHPNALAHAVKIAPVVKAAILEHTPYTFPEWSDDDETDTPVEPEEPDPVVTYTITNNLTNITISNSAASITAGAAYTARLTAADGYVIDVVAVTMGGVDVTTDSYADGIISIAAVTGDVVITAAAAAAEEPDDGTPKLVHAYGLGTVDATLEDTVGNRDLSYWLYNHGETTTDTLALTEGESFSIRTKAVRNTRNYRYNHYLHSGNLQGMHIGAGKSIAGVFWFGLENVDTSGYSDNALVNFYYFTDNDSTAKSEIIVGTKPVAQGDTVELALTWDADTSTVRLYQDGELFGEQVTTVPLKFVGFCLQGNYNADISEGGSSPCEYVEIYRGVAEI